MPDPTKIGPLQVPPGVTFFPVRHHSPRASAALLACLEAVDPDLILIEAPSDAEALLSDLTSVDTVPPIAMLAYDGGGKSVAWPLAAYSPEWVAMRFGVSKGKQVKFCDWPSGVALAHSELEREVERAERTSALREGDRVRREGSATGEASIEAPIETAPLETMAVNLGYRSFEEFWEASFEAPHFEPKAFEEALLAYADLVRAYGVSHETRARDATMWTHLERSLEAGVRPEKIVMVLGAAHAAALRAGDVDRATLASLLPPREVKLTLIPYSFARLAAQTGYGAGNRAPLYYQKAFAAGGDFHRATLDALIDFTNHLRLRGHTASLADTIEAYRLANMLADLRGKHAPGLDEVREAAIATMCRGDATHITGFLWNAVIGKAVGRVPSSVGQTSLQAEFWREVRARSLPDTDEPETFALKLNEAIQLETSTFLHRLRIANIPYASYVSAAKKATDDDVAGGMAALLRIRESWQAQWTPAVDVALLERTTMGDSLQAVVETMLGDRLLADATTSSAAHILLEALIAQTPGALAEAMRVTQERAAEDEDVPSLALAARALSNVHKYGQGRVNFETRPVLELLKLVYVRAVLRLTHACDVDPTGTSDAVGAMRTLAELAATDTHVDADLCYETLLELARNSVVAQECAGAACALLSSARRIDASETVALFVGHVAVLDAAATAGYVQGFLSVQTLTVVRSRDFVAALDAFMQSIPASEFVAVVPALRNAFSGLGLTERRYLVENIIGLRSTSRVEAKSILESSDHDKLKEISADLSRALDDLDDLL